MSSTTDDNGSAPAYPYQFYESPRDSEACYGLTKRERAAIDLRIPDSGSERLDAMTREANRRDAAMAIMPHIIHDWCEGDPKHKEGACDVALSFTDALMLHLALARDRKEGE
jgi:hypothetical protein